MLRLRTVHDRSPHRCAFALTVMIALGTAASALAQVSDVKGSKDHPMVSRYQGSTIIGYDVRKFDEFVIPLGVLKRLRVGENDFELAKSQPVEGRVTRILYVGPSDRSPLESCGTTSSS